MVDVTPYGDTALAHLNRAGDQGWELVGDERGPVSAGQQRVAPLPPQATEAGRPAPAADAGRRPAAAVPSRRAGPG